MMLLTLVLFSCTWPSPAFARKSRSSQRSYGGGGGGGIGTGLQVGGVMKVSPDTQCTLVKQTSRQGNSHCFSEQECSQQCRTVQEQSCRTVSDRQCTTVNERQCTTVNMRQGSTVNMQMCSTVNDQ